MTTARQVLLHMVTVVVVPTVLFLVGRSWWGLAGGVALALVWNLACQAARCGRGESLSVVLLLGLGSLLLRSSLALAFHSARMYFLVPSVFTVGMGITYIASAFTSRPLLEQIVGEFVPESMLERHPGLRGGLLRKATLVYGVEQLVSAAASIGLMYRISTGSYAAVHPMVSWLVLGVCAIVAWPVFRRELTILRRNRPELQPQAC